MRKRAFTLVELLVVIGIISLLISILLPSLARARQSATNLLCMSNLRSIGQGLTLYAQDHKGKLPFSGTGDWEHVWPAQVSMIMGATFRPLNDEWGNIEGNYSPILRCPDVPADYSGFAWMGGFHYTANARAMPYPQTSDGMRGGSDNGKYLPAYPISTRDAASKMLMWDGPVYPGWGVWSAPCNVSQCSYFITWGAPAPGQTVTWTNWFADPDLGFDENQLLPPANDMTFNSKDRNSATWIGHTNRDGTDAERPWDGATVGLQRYRHMGNTSGNFLYFDGHVESKKLGEVLYKDISIFPY